MVVINCPHCKNTIQLTPTKEELEEIVRRNPPPATYWSDEMDEDWDDLTNPRRPDQPLRDEVERLQGLVQKYRELLEEVVSPETQVVIPLRLHSVICDALGIEGSPFKKTN